jgi:hypothetical protein
MNSPHILIPEGTPRIQYIADGEEAAFAFPFPIFEAGDLLVYLGVELRKEGYHVGGAGLTEGGAVTFVDPPPAGSVVTLARSVPIARTTDFQEGGSFRARVLNEELDRIACMAQQLLEKFDRVIFRPITSTSVASLALPDPTAGRALKFGADGALTVSRGDPDQAQADAASSVTTAQYHASVALAARIGAEAARDIALDALDHFDDRYLGPKPGDPTTDNDGDPLEGGALYFNTASGSLRLWTGAAWVAAYVSGADYLLIANALAEIAAAGLQAMAKASLGVEVMGANVASASTVNLDGASWDYARITGTTAITAIVLSSGHRRTVVFGGALTLTHGAALILPGAANITTAPGDCAVFVGEGAGVVRCISYTKASGQAVVTPATGVTSFNTRSGAVALTSADVSAALPSAIVSAGQIQVGSMYSSGYYAIRFTRANGTTFDVPTGAYWSYDSGGG